MTVCIAAVCGASFEQGPFVIAAADRMITIGDIQYEPAQTKIIKLASQTVALCAGDMQLHAAVLPRVFERIGASLNENPNNINVTDIAGFYAEEFGYYRRSQAEKAILVPRGLNFDRFLTRQATMAHYQVSEIDARLAAYDIDSSAIIAGIDPSGGHIYKVENPGIAECYNTPFFATIGSGEALASTQFMVQRYEKNWNLPAALWLTFDAKSRAQSAGGVGLATDVVIIGRGGQLFELTGQEKIILHDLYLEVVKQEKEIAKGAISKIEEYLAKQKKEPNQSLQQTAAIDEPPAPTESQPSKNSKKRKPLKQSPTSS